MGGEESDEKERSDRKLCTALGGTCPKEFVETNQG